MLFWCNNKSIVIYHSDRIAVCFCQLNLKFCSVSIGRSVYINIELLDYLLDDYQSDSPFFVALKGGDESPAAEMPQYN